MRLFVAIQLLPLFRSVGQFLFESFQSFLFFSQSLALRINHGIQALHFAVDVSNLFFDGGFLFYLFLPCLQPCFEGFEQ